MGKNAQLDNLVGSLDQLVYASFVVAYILDGNLLGLVVRCIAQLQFSSPKTHHPDRSLTFHIGACLFVNVSTLFYHLLMPLVKSPRGMIIDFIGSNFPPNRLHLTILDLATIALQALALVLTYERVHYGEDADFNDISGSELDSDDPQDEGEGNETIHDDYSYASSYADTPVINFKLRHTVHRIMNDKPISIVEGDNAASGSSSDPTTLARLRRIHARIRQRRRDLNQAAGADGADRQEEGSDEEREIGRPNGHSIGAARSSSSPPG